MVKMIKTIWNWIKEKIHILVMGSVVLASGGAVADSAINPYIETPTRFEISKNMGDEGIQNISFAKNKPEMTLGKWNDEVNIKISRKGIFSEGNRALFSDKVKYENAKEEVHIYPLDATAEMDEGGFEYEVILKEKPNTNVFCTTYTGIENLEFYKQLPLWQEQGLSAPTALCTDTDCDTDGDGEFDTHRPDDVVNSFAVYSSSKKNYQVGQINYKTGKILHRFRVQATDANGDQIWGDSEFLNGEMCDTIPKDWLNNAQYPITL